MSRVHDAGVFEASFPDSATIVRLPPAHHLPGRPRREIDDPYRYGRVITEYDVYLFSQGKHTRIYDKLGAHLMRIGDADGVHFGVWAPNADRVSVVGDFNAWDGRVHPMRRLGPTGVWEIFIPGLAAGRALQVRDPIEPARRAAAQDGSVRIRVREAPPRHGLDRHAPRLHLERRAVADRSRRRPRLARPADGDLRGPSRIVDARAGRAGPLPDVPGAGGAADSLREGDGLHAHRAAAGDGAPVLGLVGLPGHRLLRADQPLRHAARLQGVRRRVPPGRHRRHPRLGAGAFSQGRARAGALRRHARSSSTRTRGRGSSATGAR